MTSLNNITISGHNYPTVDCNRTRSFMCKDCSSIITNDIKWMKCGFFNQTSLDSKGGLHFDTCTNLTIRFSTFVASSVQVFEASGIVNIEYVEFSDNHTNAYSPVYTIMSTIMEAFLSNSIMDLYHRLTLLIVYLLMSTKADLELNC